MRRIDCTKHAREQMCKRNISCEEVDAILGRGTRVEAHFDLRKNNRDPLRSWHFFKNFPSRKDNFLAVQAEISRNPSYDWLVITVMNNFTPDHLNMELLDEYFPAD